MPSRKRGKGGNKFGFSRKGLKPAIPAVNLETPRDEMRQDDAKMLAKQAEILRKSEQLVLAIYASSVRDTFGKGRPDEKALEKVLFDATDATCFIAKSLWGAELQAARRPSYETSNEDSDASSAVRETGSVSES